MDRLIKQGKLISLWVQYFDQYVLHLENERFIAAGPPLKLFLHGSNLLCFLTFVKVHTSHYMLLFIQKLVDAHNFVNFFDLLFALAVVVK